MLLQVIIIVGICLGLLGLSRFLERLCKHWICICDSAVTFSIVQAARRVLGVYIIGFIFHEPFSQGLWIGSICSGIGFYLKYLFRNDTTTKTTTTTNTISKGTTATTAQNDEPLSVENNILYENRKIQEHIEMSPLITQSQK